MITNQNKTQCEFAETKPWLSPKRLVAGCGKALALAMILFGAMLGVRAIAADDNTHRPSIVFIMADDK